MYFNLESCSKAFHAAFIFLLFAHSTASNSTEVEEGSSTRRNDSPSECVWFPEHSCPSQDSACTCISLAEPTAFTIDSMLPAISASKPMPSVLCCHLNNTVQLLNGIKCATSNGGKNLAALHIRNSAVGSSALSNVSEHLYSLTSLSMTDGVAPTITGHLSEIVPKLSCLNLSSNGMEDLPEDVLSDLASLRTLDLSANNVTRLPRLPHGIDGQPLWIDVSGNEHLGCSGILSAMSQNASHPLDASSSASPLGVAQPLLSAAPIYFHNKWNSTCISSKGYDWFNWTQRTPLVDIEYRIKLEKECPRGKDYSCQCAIGRFHHVPGRTPVFTVSVNCSGRGLTVLPVKLPKHTLMLNVSNNNISSLEPLGRNKYYSEILEFYADNNLISSIEVLEGSSFLQNFQVLSLSGNKLKDLPVYILQTIFDRNMIYRLMKLGRNKYNCDCNTFYELKAWVVQNKKGIHDNEEMVCDSDEPPVKIIDLQREKVCLHKTDWMDYLPVVVVAEVLLLIALVTKVSYDYWIFKTKGYLPWPASRTPKLPCCDWAFDA